ncbi:MAG: class I SAM-dependent methyltransferase [Jatrophihabitantaceae bacterium]
MPVDPLFERLLAEAEAAPVQGWDFSWFDGRASEQRPSWGYAELMGRQMAAADAALDLQTGGGEVLAGISQPPAMLCATESWPPNVQIARRKLAPLGGRVVRAEDGQPLPFRSDTFDLVVSRHPTVVLWHEITRVLRPGGRYLAQQIGIGSNRELYEYLMGPLPHPEGDGSERALRELAAAGLVAEDVRHESLEVRFDDIAAVVVFLRKVIWTVPDFSVRRYRARLADLHEQIQRVGPFLSHSQRVLVQACKPAG